MHKKVLVCLPLNDAHRAALEASVPEFEFRFNALDDVHAEDVLWADVVLGNAPVSMLSQNKHIEWFQSNSAGPDPYLKPGVLPEDCVVTNATGAYGLAISEWIHALCRQGLQRQGGVFAVEKAGQQAVGLGRAGGGGQRTGQQSESGSAEEAASGHFHGGVLLFYSVMKCLAGIIKALPLEGSPSGRAVTEGD